MLVTQGTEDSPRFDRADALSFALTFLIAGFIYWWTLPPEITLGMTGTMATGAMYAGVPHPPGYPAWTLYAWLFVKLIPFSNVAWRVAFSSAIAAAGAAGLVALMVSYAGRIFVRETPLTNDQHRRLRIVSGLVGGMALAFSGAVWSNAVLADFWSFSLLLFTGVLCLLTRWWCEPRRRFLAAAFFLFGLLLTSSQELLVVFPGLLGAIMLGHPKSGRDLFLFVTPLIVLAAAGAQYNFWLDGPDNCRCTRFVPNNWPFLVGFVSAGVSAAAILLATRRLGTEWKLSLICGLCLAFGLAFYLYPPIASMTTPPVNWSYPRTFEGFQNLIRRGQYESVNTTEHFGTFVTQVWNMARIVAKDFGWVYLPFAALAFGLGWRLNRSGRRWMLGLLAVFLCVGPLLVGLLNPPDPYRDSVDLLKRYFAPAFTVLAVWSGVGLMLLVSKFCDAGAGGVCSGGTTENSPAF